MNAQIKLTQSSVFSIKEVIMSKQIKKFDILIALILLSAAILSGCGTVDAANEMIPVSTQEADLVSSSVSIAKPDPTPALDEEADLTGNLDTSMNDEQRIIAAIAEKLGYEINELVVTIVENSGSHAKGGVRHINEVGGGYFIAAKLDDRWVIAHGGQTYPSCAAIDAYAFPTDMVPECLDENNNLVVRTSTEALTGDSTGDNVGDAAVIQAALVASTSIPAENLEFTITHNTGDHVKGNLRHIDEVGGGYFIAAKVDHRWMIVYHGQAAPACNPIEAFGFPIDMVPECLDENSNLVVRTAAEFDPNLTSALAERLGVAGDEVSYTIVKESGEFVLGYLPNGYFLAVHQSDNWEIVYDGQATPQCDLVEPYDFPVEMVPDCLDENHSLVDRTTS
jgi:hypothetical protein